MNFATFPLLIQGFDLTGAGPGLATRDQNTFTKNRGDIHAVDFLATEEVVFSTDLSLTIGGINIIEEAQYQSFVVNAFPSVYQFPEGVYKGGQTWNTLMNNAAINTAQAQLLVMHENPYNTPEMMARLDRPYLGLKNKDYKVTANAGIKGVTGNFILPKNQGQVIGVQIMSDYVPATRGDYLDSRISLKVNGQDIILNASTGLGIPDAARPYLIFPIQIDPASPFVITIDNNGTANIISGIRFFFDSVHAEPEEVC